MNVHPSITIYQMPIVSFPIFKLHKLYNKYQHSIRKDQIFISMESKLKTHK
uniref:Uncharacterized protein n=1 Tax=Rhizophora mucronata TaxID=61149 RepID=A0A2P2JUU0_RHIMU